VHETLPVNQDLVADFDAGDDATVGKMTNVVSADADVLLFAEFCCFIDRIHSFHLFSS
jgi:hypothetical protein